MLKAQDFSAVWQKAQKLKADSNYKGAIAIYDKEIQKILAGDTIYQDYHWIGFLALAGRIYEGRENKYDNLLYGTKAEKLNEKIEFLKDAGVENMLSYEIKDREHGVISFVYSSCHSTTKRALVWLMNKHIYMQVFDDCNTYKPLKILDTELVTLFEKHLDNITTDSLERPNYIPKERIDYQFKFYSGDKIFNKDWVSRYFLRIPNAVEIREMNEKPVEFPKKDNVIYKSNSDSYFGKMFLRLIQAEKTYTAFINSASERAKIGKIE
ncbi:hypothetical protein GCM10028827_22660 [Mucilaginibacter myungsuensis]